MKSYPVHRGADNEIEFKGLRGRHFYYAASGLIGSVFCTLFGYIVGLPPLLAVFVLLAGSGATLGWSYRNNTRYGRWGADKWTVQRLKPHFIFQYDSFNRLLATQPIPKRKPTDRRPG
jgi:hypothetical protein